MAGNPSLESTLRDYACTRDQQEQASARLKALHDEDQRVRKEGLSFSGDLARRVEVGAIFARGCMRKAADFYHGAMVYQHGTVPEHYYMAYLWAKRAVELGDARGTYLIPRAIDRYLMNLGQRQLFGSNMVTRAWWDKSDRPGKAGKEYWCLFPVEPAFTDERRAAFGFRPLQESHAWVAEKNRRLGIDHGGEECPLAVKPTAKGTIPGIW